MKGLLVFLRETWWLFAATATATVVIGYVTKIWLYYLFPIVLVPIILYMATVRYDSDGNLREEQRRR